jgi:hypothetical protein
MPLRYLPLSLPEILRWARAHRKRTGRWPTQRSGPIPGADVTWTAVAAALREGLRGLPGGDSLACLLARELGAEPASGKYHRVALTPDAIFRWAEAHHQRTGRWPTAASGVVEEAPEETWGAINQALLWGRRGLPAGSSLSRLLTQRHGPGRPHRRPRLKISSVMAWAEAHRRRTGRWPTAASGPIHEAPEETWHAVNLALTNGTRGLPGRQSLTQLLRRSASAAATA